MRQPRVLLIGGFLGAGKTTLVAQTARRLTSRGQRVAIVTNDQAANLVDTGLLKADTPDVGEVADGCFCCHFDDFIGQLQRLSREQVPDVLIGEPVGSCTDLSATVMQPLKRVYADVFRTAPFSVLVDPVRWRESLAPRGARSFPDSVLYIYRLQIEEADVIVLNKVDTLPTDELATLKQALTERYPGRPIFTISALSGQGVEEWLDWVLGDQKAGQRITEVNYDTYADGEAVLGWLNASVRLEGEANTDWGDFCQRLLGEVRGRLRAGSAEIAHAKVLLTTAGGAVAANLTSNTAEPSVRGRLAAPSATATLVVNVRAHIGPEALREAVTASLRTAAGEAVREQITQIESFSPSRPQPTHRYGAVV